MVSYTINYDVNPPQMKISKSCFGCACEASFSKDRDTVYYQVIFGGRNGRVCVEARSDDGRVNNYGNCRNTASTNYKDPGSHWTLNGGRWQWSDQLSLNPFVVKGTYRFHWYNPDTNKKVMKEV